MSDKLGPYQLNSIITGECSELMAALPADSIDLTVTSPPYGDLRAYRGYTFDFPAIARQLYRVTKPGGVVVWVVADETKNGSESGTSFRQALGFMELGFNLHDTMIYEALGTGAKGSNKAYWQAFEYMFVLSKGSPIAVNRLRDKPNRNNGKKIGTGQKAKKLGSRVKSNGNIITPEYSVRTNVWRYHTGANGDDQTDHEAPFPEALARDHILSWSNPGDLVFDPMTGSGTVAKMAHLTGRNFLGFEISPEYTDLARQRVEMAMSQPALFNAYQPAAKPESIQLEFGG